VKILCVEEDINLGHFVKEKLVKHSYVIPELKELWDQCCKSYKERLFVIQEAVAALDQGKLSPKQQHEAEAQAHTLIGSLGSFGLDKASEICRQIQQILQQKRASEKIQVEELKLLVTELEHYFELDESITSSVISPRLLIIDNETVLAENVVQEAISWGFTAQISTNLEKIEQILANSTVDIILLDVNFQNDITVGLNFLAKLRSEKPEILVVIVTQEDSFSTRLEVARLGVPCFLQKPIASTQILTILKEKSTQRHPSLYRLLVVDDDPELLKLVYKLLSPYGYEVILLAQPQQFWETLEQTNPDLLILDVQLFPTETSKNIRNIPLNGFDLCLIIRSDLRWNRLPILFLSAHTNSETIQRSFAVGANDFLSKPIVVEELQTRVDIRLQQRQTWKVAEIDALTGVSLRSKALQDLTRLLQQAQRRQLPFSLAVLDLDFFKPINDKYGHQTGDRVLSYLGQLLNQSFRTEDVIGRWGGEEFVIGMYNTTGQVSRERLTQVLEKFRQHLFTIGGEDSFQVTFSAGIAQSPQNGKDLQTLFLAADVTLYKAKTQGRNQVLLTASDYPD
jgi:diguanylate cyclase (GGDEF)-like protein